MYNRKKGKKTNIEKKNYFRNSNNEKTNLLSKINPKQLSVI